MRIALVLEPSPCKLRMCNKRIVNNTTFLTVHLNFFILLFTSIHFELLDINHTYIKKYIFQEHEKDTLLSNNYKKQII